MNTIIKHCKYFVATLLSSLAAPAVFAHPGHSVDASLHSLLHVEHIIVLALAASVSLAIYARRNK